MKRVLNVTPASACSVPAASSSAMKRLIPVISIMPSREFIPLSPQDRRMPTGNTVSPGGAGITPNKSSLNRGEATSCGVRRPQETRRGAIPRAYSTDLDQGCCEDDAHQQPKQQTDTILEGECDRVVTELTALRQKPDAPDEKE
jgi:hypothetical protein